jgi:hypothetical protein
MNYGLDAMNKPRTKKIYRLKEDQAFWLSLELGRREKVERHPSADFLPPPHMFMTVDRQWRSFSLRRGWSGFGRYYVLLPLVHLEL